MPKIYYSDEIKAPCITPTTDNGDVTVDIAFTFQDKTCSFSIQVPQSIYNGAKYADKSLACPAYNGREWEHWYYPVFATDKSQESVLQSLLFQFRQFKEQHHLSRDEYCELLTLYVQSLPYDSKKLELINNTNEVVPTRFAIETIVDGTGICCESSILLAALLRLEGYAVSLLSFDNELHMVVGIPSALSFDYHCSGYAVIETVAVKYVGDASTTLAGISHALWSRPRIITIRSADDTKYELDGLLYQTYSILKAQRILTKKTDINSPMALVLKNYAKDIDILNRTVTDLEHKRDSTRKKLNHIPSGDKLYRVQYMEYILYKSSYDNEHARLSKKMMDFDELNNRMDRMKDLLVFIHQNVRNRKMVYSKIKKQGDLLK